MRFHDRLSVCSCVALLLHLPLPRAGMISERLGHRLDSSLSRVALFLFGKDINPNFLTIVGLLINVGAAFCLGLGYWISAGILIAAAGFFDTVDGAVARTFKKATKFGGFLDSVIDRYSDIFLIIGIIWFYAVKASLGYVFLACIVLMGCILVPYSRAKAEIFLDRCNIGIMERAERTILLAVGSIFNIMNIVLWILAIFTHVTVVQRIHYTWKRIHEIEEPTLNQE
jgi:CDP-diacylglycerol---glycerol-3-phosphate 3-phosphatidyltransferase